MGNQALVGANQSNSIPKPRTMVLKFPQLPLLVLCLFCSVIIAHKDEDPVTKTMEDFSGYPIDEPHSFFQKSLSLLSVDTESLQKEVLGFYLKALNNYDMTITMRVCVLISLSVNVMSFAR